MALLLFGFRPATNPPRPLKTGSFRLPALATGCADRRRSCNPSSISRVRLVRCCAASALALASRESLISRVVFINFTIQKSVFKVNRLSSSLAERLPVGRDIANQAATPFGLSPSKPFDKLWRATAGVTCHVKCAAALCRAMRARRDTEWAAFFDLFANGRTKRNATLLPCAYFFLAIPSAEQGFSVEQRSPITPTAWISISMPGRAKLVTVMSALPG